MMLQAPLSKLLHLPILAVVAVGLCSIGVSISILYSTAVSEQRERLREISESRARLIETIARFDKKFSGAFPGTPYEATISQLVEAHALYKEYGETSEFVLAARDGDQIQFILNHRQANLEELQSLPFDSELAEPMRRALLGQRGTMVGQDYRGEQVLAAYEPVAVLDLGIVVKIDLSEIRKPFIIAGMWALMVSGCVIFIAIQTILRFTRPMSNQLIQMTEAANDANRAKSRFLAAMSHDLRTPLNAILGFSDMMRMETFGKLGDKHYKDYANDIHQSGTLLVELINDVLDISKVEAGKVQLTEKPIKLLNLVNSCVHQIGPLAKASNHTISHHIPPDLPALLADERILVQLLNNLLSNAIKFTPNGGKITVSAELSTDNAIVFEISDTGIGMSDIEVERALKEFEQLDGSQERQHKGSGLGLHLCTKFMKLFDGSLGIVSVKDEGTTVSLRFPPERTAPA